MAQNSNYKWKLGMFVILGLILFMITIYFIGNNKNLFRSTFQLKSHFKNVSGLKEGNNVRFSGINVGTVKDIEFISDSAVVVNLIIKQEVQKYIKTDAIASIGSDGLMGDKVLTISPGTASNTVVKDKDLIKSTKAVEIEDIMKSVKLSADNAAIITSQLAIFTNKMNNSKGVLSKLMTDATFANSLTKTLSNLESSTDEFAVFTKKMNNKKGVLSKLVTDEKLGNSVDSTLIELNETVKAAQNNFLLKGYFNKKKKADAKKKKAEDKKNKEEAKKKLVLDKEK
ncbi:MlaD family protein [Flavobacterium sp.]|uniref:MlaD family protein n=1 Tax=Flavobacterium sp. TaxID=239 RepID=UPI00374D6751